MDKGKQEQFIENTDETTLKEFILKVQGWWRFFLSKWLSIAIAGLIGGAIGLSYAWISKPIYKAELSFALQDEKPGGGLNAALGVASQFGIDLSGGSVGGEFSGDNLLELMKSRSMIEKTLLTSIILNKKKETLAEYYIDFNEFRKHWKGKPEESIHFTTDTIQSKFSLKQDSILGIFYRDLIKNSLTVDKVDKKLSIITLTVKSTDELFSKEFAERLAKVVSEFYVQTKTEKFHKNVVILQRQTDSVRRMLNGNISGVNTSIDVNPNPNPLLLATLRTPSQRRQVDVTVNTAILSQLVTNLEIAKMSLLQETPLIQVIDEPILPLEKEKVGKLKELVIGGVIGIIIMVVVLAGTTIFKNVMS